MSIRAYKIKHIEYSKTPAFNLWHNKKFTNWLETTETTFYIDENGGRIEIPVNVLKEALENHKEL